MKTRMFFAGSGGQGILLMGQMIAKAAMLEGREVTFMPSYGPEMRGGTANCTVIISDKTISCPLISETDILVVMNKPSLIRFESMLTPGGTLFINSSLIAESPTRDDIVIVNVPANDRAAELGIEKSANMVMLGAVVNGTGVVSMESVDRVLGYIFSEGKAALYSVNHRALHINA
ncbi:MAG: 2-oxoacid:ferredoxin oxidoreductase subunit gamma [Clostridiales bacterium]|jgi:2-oxoglutarate ferredoxin oxidoreductase subunit gamma|nr:2-oxoacid:ferredoxin oxidoreductase subunit gamma [Clostridiales bacterium]